MKYFFLNSASPNITNLTTLFEVPSEAHTQKNKDVKINCGMEVYEIAK